MRFISAAAGLESTGPGAHIVRIDDTGFGFFEVNATDVFIVHNTSGGTLAGNVTLIY